jgi:arylsulfatase A-like enzyme
LYEGGIRVPMIARWPGRIGAATTSAHVGANWDMWATFADLAGAEPPADTDGISVVPTLLARDNQRQHEALYWEFHSRGSSQAVRTGRWKAIRNNVAKDPEAPIELYDLERDPRETTNLAATNPDVVRRAADIMRRSHTPAALPRWNLKTSVTAR